MHTILVTTSSFGKNDLTPIERLKLSGFSVVLNPYKRKLTEAEVASLIEKFNPIGIIAGIEPLTKNIFKKAKDLKAISRCGIGLDSVDLEAAKNLSITVTNTPDAPTIPVAELTLGLMLSVLRKIHVSHLGICGGKWQRPMGNLLYAKTVGIIGCGRIGSYLAKLLSSFGCKVIGYDPVFSKTTDCHFTELDDLLSTSDIISLHIPYNLQNHHFIDEKKIQNMKEGAILINAARGGLINEDALYEALIKGHLRGAALDCFEEEPYSGKLVKLNNVLLTGHIGSYAIEGRIMMEKQAVENLLKELTS